MTWDDQWLQVVFSDEKKQKLDSPDIYFKKEPRDRKQSTSNSIKLSYLEMKISKSVTKITPKQGNQLTSNFF